MELLFKIFLMLHIAGGATGLTTGTLNIVRKKGGVPHKRVGKIFVYSMLLAGCSALVLSVLHEIYFLFIVGIFTIYMTATGQRYLQFKQAAAKPGPVDWLLSGGMMFTGLVFITLGIMRLVHANNFGIVFIVFGAVGIRFSIADIGNYNGKSKVKNFWLIGHLQRMTGSYIAAITAFLVVNGKYFPASVPSFVIWLLPTVVLVPLIAKWTAKYRQPQKK